MPLSAHSDTESQVRDIILVWELAFEAKGVSTERIRHKFPVYARYISDAVDIYKRPHQIEDRRIWLPNHRSTHIIAAVVAFMESRLRHKTIGEAHREVGIFQVHGKALAGFKRKEVRNSPELGILLGVRWLTYSLSQCSKSRRKILRGKPWSINDWLGPISVYAAGPKVIQSKGKCRVLRLTRYRISMVRKLMRKIDRKLAAESGL